MNSKLNQSNIEINLAKILTNEGIETELSMDEITIDGEIPFALKGTLLRNGPGIFQRGNQRCGSLIDGDGFLQKFTFSEGTVSYQSKFVRTKKFLQESVCGRYIYPTWSKSIGSVNPLKNVNVLPQAGVSLLEFQGKLYAADDNGTPYEICPKTLTTLGVLTNASGRNVNAFAHSKVDDERGELISFSLSYGARPSIHLKVLNREYDEVWATSLKLKHNTYLHDFFVTENFIIFLVNPLMLKLTDFLFGRQSFIDSLRFEKKRASELLVVDRRTKALLFRDTVSATFMWHGVGAFESNDGIAIYACTYDDPEHFIGDNAALSTLVNGQLHASKSRSSLKRYDVNLATHNVTERTESDVSFEFPLVEQHQLGKPFKSFFAALNGPRHIFHQGLMKFDLEHGVVDQFFFDEHMSVGEPILAGDFLLALTTNAQTARTSLAIFAKDNLQQGPVAQVHLPFCQPFSLHGIFLEEVY